MSLCPNTTAQWVGFCLWILADSFWEYRLGKSEKYRASSKVELAVCVFKWLVNKILKKGE